MEVENQKARRFQMKIFAETFSPESPRF